MINEKTLDCGIRIVTEQIPYVQSVSIGIWVKAGAVDETVKTAGISHLIEHMLFKGTENRSAKQIAEDVEKIGGQINAFTGKEGTCYYIKTFTSNVEKACEILSDMFLNSLFDKTELEKEKNVIYEEMKMIEDSPEDIVHDNITELVFKGQPLAKSIIGTKSALKGITQKIIKKYIKDEYTRDKIVISLAGNFDEKKVFSYFDKKLDCLTEKKEIKKSEIPLYVPSYRVKVKDVEQSHLCIGVPGIPIDDDRYYTMSLLSSILGGSMSSRLFQNIREQKGLAYSVYAISSSYSTNGYFNIYAGVGHDKLEETIVAIGDELSLLKNNGIEADEFHIAQEQLKGSYIFSMESVNSKMFSNGKNTLILGRTYTLENIIEDIEKVTIEDVLNISEMITDINQYSGALVGNKKKNLKRMLTCS